MKRMNLKDVEPNAFKAMLGLEKYISNTSLPRKLCELIKIRASQMNGCAYCLDMHTREALEEGESQTRIFALSAWRESPHFTEEERAVLELTEEVTEMGKYGVSDATYNTVLQYYGEATLAQLIMQIIIINSWNRIAVSTHQIFESLS